MALIFSNSLNNFLRFFRKFLQLVHIRDRVVFFQQIADFIKRTFKFVAIRRIFLNSHINAIDHIFHSIDQLIIRFFQFFEHILQILIFILHLVFQKPPVDKKHILRVLFTKFFQNNSETFIIYLIQVIPDYLRRPDQNRPQRDILDHFLNQFINLRFIIAIYIHSQNNEQNIHKIQPSLKRLVSQRQTNAIKRNFTPLQVIPTSDITVK